MPPKPTPTPTSSSSALRLRLLVASVVIASCVAARLQPWEAERAVGGLWRREATGNAKPKLVTLPPRPNTNHSHNATATTTIDATFLAAAGAADVPWLLVSIRPTTITTPWGWLGMGAPPPPHANLSNANTSSTSHDPAVDDDDDRPTIIHTTSSGDVCVEMCFGRARWWNTGFFAALFETICVVTAAVLAVVLLMVKLLYSVWWLLFRILSGLWRFMACTPVGRLLTSLAAALMTGRALDRMFARYIYHGMDSHGVIWRSTYWFLQAPR